MKKIFCLILLIFTVGNASAQAPAELQSEVKKLYLACHDIDITLLTEMLCSSDPKMYSTLDSYFLNDDTKFRYVETNAKYNYGEQKVIDGKTYIPINFRNVVRVTYFKTINVADKQAELKIKFNTESVAYNAQRNAFMVIYNAKMVAVGDGGKWKFVFTDNTLPELSESCLTETIKKELGL